MFPSLSLIFIFTSIRKNERKSKANKLYDYFTSKVKGLSVKELNTNF